MGLGSGFLDAGLPWNLPEAETGKGRASGAGEDALAAVQRETAQGVVLPFVGNPYLGAGELRSLYGHALIVSFCRYWASALGSHQESIPRLK